MVHRHGRSGEELAALGFLALLILLSWTVRLYRLDAKSIWSDEGLSIYRARQSVPFILTNQIVIQGVVTKDTQPPLYFLLLHAFRAVGGESEFALRYLSALFSIPLIPLLYVVGRRLISRIGSLMAAGLGAISAAYLWYAQEMRMYTMLVALSLLSIYALLRTLWEPVGWRRSKVLWLWAYLVCIGAAIYTHYSAFFLLAFQALVIAVFVLKSRRWRMAALMGVATVAALPLLPFIWRRLSEGVERDYSFVPLNIILHDLLNGFTVGISAEIARVLWLDLLGLALFLLGVLTLRGDEAWGRGGKALFLLGYLFLPILILYFASHIKPMYMGVRHLLLVSPAYYLGLAAGLAQLWRRRTWPVSLFLGLLLLGGSAYATHNYFYNPRYTKDDLRSLVRYIRDRFRPGDALVLNDAVIGEAFAYYAPDLPWTALPSYGRFADVETLRSCQALAQSYERIWYVHGPPATYYDPQQIVRQWFEEHLWKLDFRQFPGYGVEVGTLCYATRSPVLEVVPAGLSPPARGVAPQAPLRLLGYELPPEPVPSGDALPIVFYWWLSGPMDSDFKLSLRLIGPEGEYWAQGDDVPFYFFPAARWPLERVIRQVHELLLPPATPPGSYRLELRIYHPDTGAPIPFLWPDGTLSVEGCLPLVGQVQIGPPKRPVQLSELPPHRKVSVAFGEVSLVAYTWWDRTYRPGDVAHFDLYWRAERQPAGDYRLRVELATSRTQVLQSIERALVLDALPTSAWPVGYLFRGQCNLKLPSALTAGDYRFRIQVYDPQSGRVLPCRQGWFPLKSAWFDLDWFPVRP